MDFVPQTQRQMKILWAIDPFDQLRETEDRIVKVLKKYSEIGNIEIYPTYVLSPGHLVIEFKGAAEKALEAKLQGISIQGLEKYEVVTDTRSSFKSNAQTLWKHAKNKGCDFIVVGSHGRKGVQRLFLGSFAETLFLLSEIPVMVIGSHSTQPLDHFPLKMLVPNDLTLPNSPFFKQAFSFASFFKMKTTLLSAIVRPIETSIQSGVYLLSGGWPVFPDFMEKNKKQREDAAATIRKNAFQYDLPLEVFIDEKSFGITQSILTFSRDHNVDLITMAAESGPIASALIGSITRQVVREAPCPVLVLRAPPQTA